MESSNQQDRMIDGSGQAESGRWRFRSAGAKAGYYETSWLHGRCCSLGALGRADTPQPCPTSLCLNLRRQPQRLLRRFRIFPDGHPTPFFKYKQQWVLI